MSSYTKLTPKLALQLAAPHTWVASAIPAIFGIIFCKLYGYNLTSIQSLFLLIACILMQSSVNTFNDYVDFIKGTDSVEDNVEVSDAVLIYNPVNPKHVLILGIIYLILGCGLGSIACIGKGALPLMIGIIGAIIVILYSGGPVAISYLPIGEFVSGFVMGILIPLGIGAAADGKFHSEFFLYALPLFLGIGLIMMTNNGCDIEKDREAGRFTLAVALGRESIKKLYHISIITWLSLIIVLSFIQFKIFGAIIIVFLLLGFKPFLFLLNSRLLPEDRIKQMKMIVLANIVGNGSYILVILINLCLGDF